MTDNGVSDRGSGIFTRVVERWVEAVRRAAVWVTAIAATVTVLAAAYTVDQITINTDTHALISPELPFRRDTAAFNAAFPQFSDTIAVVLDGDSVDRAADAQRALVARLTADRTHFRTVFAPDAEPFFDRNGLLFLDTEALADLSDRLADAQAVLARLAADPTLRGLFDVLGLGIEEVADGEPPPAGLEDMLARLEAVALSVARGSPRPLSWTDLMRGKSSSAADRRRFVMVQPVLDFASLKPAAEAMAAIRAHAGALGLDEAGGVRLRLTGGAVMASEELESVSRGAGLAGLISLVLVGAILGVGLRSGRLVAAVLATLIMGLCWTAGFTTLVIGHLNLISVAFAVLFIGLAVDFGIHFGLRYKEETDRGGDHAAALRRATGGVAGALGLCTLAAAASFYAFVPTNYDGLSELGLIAGTGMFIALLANLTVLPALLTLLPLRPGRATDSVPVGAERYVRRHARPVLIAALILGVAGVALLPSARFDFNPVSLRDPSTESVQTFLELMAESETAPYTIQVLAPSLDAARRLATRLGQLPEVDRAVTLADFVPADQEEKLAIVEQMAIFLAPLLQPGRVADAGEPDRREAVAQFRDRLARLVASPATDKEPSERAALRERARSLGAALGAIEASPPALAQFERAVMLFLPERLDRLRRSLAATEVTAADLPEPLRERYLAGDGTARIQVFPAQNIKDNVALDRFVTAVQRIAPHATDSPVEIVESGRVVVLAVRDAAVIALVAITLLLIAVFRNLRDTVLVIIPLALAALLTVAASVILGLPFNFANVIVLPLLAGLGVASGIHLVVRARHRGRDQGLTETSTPRAVILSALTTIGSFGSLSVSGHRGTASMGELLTIAIAFTLVCTLVVLPAMMSWVNARRQGDEVPPP